MRTIFVPPHAGVLSALGLAITSERRERMTSVFARVDTLDAAALAHELHRAADGLHAETTWSRRWTARVRYVGQGHEVDVPVEPGDNGVVLASRFETLHSRRNGFTLDAAVEVIGLRHVASGPAHDARFQRTGASAWSDGRQVDDGGQLDVRVDGPSVIVLAGATLRISPGWRGVPHETGGWMLERLGAP